MGPEIIRGLLIGLSREVARQTERPAKEPFCQHAAWFIANGGYGLTLQQIATGAGVSKQAVDEAIKRMADRCDDRILERNILRVADIFEVTL